MAHLSGSQASRDTAVASSSVATTDEPEYTHTYVIAMHASDSRDRAAVILHAMWKTILASSFATERRPSSVRWAEASRTIQTFCLILMIWRDQPCTCSIAPVREPSVAIHVRTRGCGYLFGCLRLLLVRVYLSLGVWFSCGPTLFTRFLFLAPHRPPS